MTLETDNLPLYLRGEIINVVVIDMDPGIPEQITLNSDGSYTLFLNSRASHDTQIHCFYHAADHIRHNDWEKSDVQEIEFAAHRL